MYCDGCGSAFSAGAQYCNSCGKRLIGAPAPAAATSRASGAGDGRVRRNLRAVAGFWLAYGILYSIRVGWLVIFRDLAFSHGWGWIGGEGWPFGMHALSPLLWAGFLSTGLFIGAMGLAYLVLAWGLYQRAHWARVLGIVLGLLVLIKIPFGTALGIYTLWVFLPEGSKKEYEQIVSVA